jgi:hypothetical protein
MMHTETYPTKAPHGVSGPRRASADALRLAAARANRRNDPDASWITAPPPVDITAERTRPSRRSRLPELEPADAPRQPHKPFIGIDMSSDAVMADETRFSHREETKSETARLTVYALNATLLIMAFPVGFGMLVFNILGGENLRTTAHVMALTGMGIALSASGAAGILFQHI